MRLTFRRDCYNYVFFILLSAGLTLPQITSAASKSVNNIRSGDISLLHARAKQQGSVPVIIKLKVATTPEGLLTSTAESDQKARIYKSRNALLGKLEKFKPARIKKFNHLPVTAMELNADGLVAALSDPNVEAVYEDRLFKPTLIDSTSLIGATAPAAINTGGKGQVVAVLDTGVDSNHPFLAGKVVHEACFSKTYNDSTTVCPNGNSSQIGPGSAVPCPVSGCAHGTHVAGIVAGKSNTFSGVAPQAGIMAIQIFSEFTGSVCGGATSCVLAYTSDMISGLEHIYSQRNAFNIASVNMSLGGGSYATTCDDYGLKPAIDLLRSAGIATIVAAGNDGLSAEISAPACISSAISVGATSKFDEIASYSNSSAQLDLLAPGSYIQSSVPGAGYAYYSGTSMATPHVAGAFAVMRSRKPTSTVSELLDALKTTGVSLQDARNNLIRPRIALDQAMQLISPTTIKQDFNVDGKADILWRNVTSGINWMYNMNGVSITTNKAVNTVADINWKVAGVADLDGDGDADILWRHAITGMNWIFLMNGSTVSSSVPLNLISDLNWYVSGTGDLDGDGKEDILWRNSATGENWLYLMNGASFSPAYINKVSDQNWKITGIADLNADGKSDILWRNSTTGENWVYLMNGASFSSAYINTVPDLNWKIVGTADLNADGKSDILWRHAINGRVWSYLMNANKIIKSNSVTTVSDPNWKISRASDFNGDGKADILWRNTLSGINWMYLMDGTAINQSAPLNVVSPDWKLIER